PSKKPASPRPLRNASTRCGVSSGDLALRYPITGIAGCCARATSGHAAAAPPRRARKPHVVLIDRIAFRLLPARAGLQDKSNWQWSVTRHLVARRFSTAL